MKKLLLACILFFLGSQATHPSDRKILIFAGAASKPATQQATETFRRRTGISADVTFGGSGFLLSQMSLAKKGDLYFPGSSDFMEKAKRDGLILPESERKVVYLVPAINVQKGNPKGIRSLRDLARAGLRLVIADPEMVCVGTYAVEIIEMNLSAAEKRILKKNIVSYAESCEKTAHAISLKTADAVIGWSVFQYWDPGRIETILLDPEQVPRVGYIPIAITKFTKQKDLAQSFIDFLLSPEGAGIFLKYHYFTDVSEARRYTRHNAPIGGEYNLPPEWRLRSR